MTELNAEFSSDVIDSRLTGHVLTITMTRFDKKNALTLEMYRQMNGVLVAAAKDERVKVVVLQGNAECFTSGNDLQDFLSAGKLDSNHPTVGFISLISTFEKPLLAAVAGPAVGLGVTMLMHCEYVACADNAVFQMPFTKLGLCPEAASSYLLPLISGYQKAAELLLFGEAFYPEQAVSMGLVNKQVEADALLEHIAERAQTLASLSTPALMASKRLLKKGYAAAINTALHDELNDFEQLLHSPECKQIIAGFFARK